MRSVAFALLLGCRPATPAPDPDRVAIKQVVAEVEYLRQLPHKAPIVVHLVDEKTFGKAMANEFVPDSAEQERAWLVAFSLAPADVDLRLAADRATQAIGAVYDFDSKRLMVPKGTGFNQESLAHEVGHALADQHFGIVIPVGDEERVAAYRAFVEGDAAVTQALYVNRHGAAGPSAFLWAVASERADSERALVAADGPYSHLASWIPIYRDEIILRYSHGFRFVAALHRAGGFSLVDRAWKQLPTTTEQILHPEKYLIGEAAIPVETPPVPPNTTSVYAGVAGEMGIRGVLGMCVEDDVARAAAAGWGGDAVRIVRRDDGALSLLWSTVWDDEAAAQRFESAVVGAKSCWDAAVTRDAKTPMHLAPGIKIARDGTRVAVTRGFDGDLAIVAKDPPARVPPLGAVKLLPFPHDLDPPQGTLAGRRFEYPAFGIALAIPDEMTPGKPAEQGIGLTGPEGNVWFDLFVTRSGIDEELVERFKKTMSKVQGPYEALIVDAGRDTVATPLGDAEERRFLRGGLTMRVYLMRICGGLRTVVVRGWWVGEPNRHLFEAALAGLSRTGSDPPPACR